MLLAGDHVRVPLRELQITFVRSSGAGGQNVNKVSSKAVLRWSVATTTALTGPARARFLTRYGTRVTTTGDVVLTSDRHRDQGRNVADCLEKLRRMLAEIEHPPRPRTATRPTRASRERRLDAKRATSQRKQLRGGPSKRDLES